MNEYERITCPNCGNLTSLKDLISDEFGDCWCPECIPEIPDEENLEELF